MKQRLIAPVLFSTLTPALSPLRGEGDGAALTLESVLVFRLFSCFGGGCLRATSSIIV